MLSVIPVTHRDIELLKARNPRLVQRTVMVHGERGVYPRLAWVLPGEANTDKAHAAQFDLFDPEAIPKGGNISSRIADNEYAGLPPALAGKPIRLITVVILSKGRKYFKAHYKGKDYLFDIVINDETKDFKQGKEYTLPVVEEKHTDRYGTKTTCWPIHVSEERQEELKILADAEHAKRKAALQERIEKEKRTEAERWLGYVEDKALQGYLYKNGVKKLDEMNLDQWSDIKDRLREAKKTAKETGYQTEAKQALGWIEDKLHEYWYRNGEARVKEAIDGLKAIGCDGSELESRLAELKLQYKEAEEKKTRAGYEGKDVIKIAIGSGYGGYEYQPNTVIRNPRKEDPRYLYVLSARKQYFPEEGMSFGVGEDRGYIYYATTRAATEDEAAPLAKEDKDFMDREEAKRRALEISREIKDRGEAPREAIPRGRRVLDTSNIYGGGSWFVIGDDYIWYVQNNGADGDNWGYNNVRTGGAGAIGWRVPYSAELAKEIDSLSVRMQSEE